MKTMQITLCILYYLLISSCGDLTDTREKSYHTVTYSEIYSMNVDGTDTLKLTNDKNYITFMKYLPNTDKILFVQSEGTYLIGTDGNQKQLLSNDKITNAIITQDEKTAYFIKSEVSGIKINSILYSMSLTTGIVKQILQDSNGISGIGISPDGSQLLYNSTSIAPKPSSFNILNLATMDNKKIKEGVNIRWYYPQFVTNTNQILYFDKFDFYKNDSYIRIMNLSDTSNNQVFDTVSSYLFFDPSINSQGNIFYIKGGITVWTIANHQKKVIPFTYNDDYMNWSIDGTKIISTDNKQNQIIIYNVLDLSTLIIKSNQIQLGNLSSFQSRFKYPYLNINNTKVFFTFLFEESKYY